MQVHFNTGRLYTAQGQIILASWEPENEVIHFADFSRACHGTIACPTFAAHFTRPGPLAEFVMNRYDRGEYKTTESSWALLMMAENRPTTEPLKMQI